LGVNLPIRLAPRIDLWISKQDWSPATCNRYKALLSKTFKLALAVGKVAINPARLVEQRTESAGRIRYCYPMKELQLRNVIYRGFPNHDPALTVALRTGMRKGEQFSLVWPEVSFERNRIYVNKTKNGSDREIPISTSCREALLTLRKQRPGNGRTLYSKFGEPLNDPRTWFELAIAEAKIANFAWHDLRHTFWFQIDYVRR
jgi:integrase